MTGYDVPFRKATLPDDARRRVVLRELPLFLPTSSDDVRTTPWLLWPGRTLLHLPIVHISETASHTPSPLSHLSPLHRTNSPSISLKSTIYEDLGEDFPQKASRMFPGHDFQCTSWPPSTLPKCTPCIRFIDSLARARSLSLLDRCTLPPLRLNLRFRRSKPRFYIKTCLRCNYFSVPLATQHSLQVY